MHQVCAVRHLHGLWHLSIRSRVVSLLAFPERARPSVLLTHEVLDRARILDTLVNNLDGMAYRCRHDENWTMIFVSEGCTALTGYTPSDLVEGGCISWEVLTHAEDRQRVRDSIDEAARTGRRFAQQYRINTRSGGCKWVLERGVTVADEQGHTVIEGFVEDISEQRAMIQALERAELRYRSIFEHASEGIFQTSKDGRYLSANPALARLYGYDSPAALITHLSDIARSLYVEPDRREVFRRMMEVHGGVRNFESEVYRNDGSRMWISENAHIVRDAQGEFICYEGTVQDISERKSYQEQLERQANHDLLTGLPNRVLLSDRLSQGLARAHRRGYYLAVVFIDLDKFKFVNDSLGHAAGDQLLQEVANRLSGCLRQSDTVARLGGDEFVLVLNDHYHVSTIIAQLERVLQQVHQPITLCGRSVQVGASLGVSLFPDDSQDEASLLRHADIAMYAAKERGRHNYQFFTRDLNRMAQERLYLEAAMRDALDDGAFEVHYQPKVDHRRRIVGVEALARWHHPSLGAIAPDRFIPVAEDTGLIMPLTTVILRKAFAAAQRWNPPGAPRLQMAVNLSARLFMGGDVVSQVVALAREAGVSPDLIELEITESVFLNQSQSAIDRLRAFKQHGFSLAMDDFGTGYSSLSYLRSFPLDTIKIDRSLVTDIEREEEGALIARAVISLGQSLRKRMVAEGVENQAQFDFLQGLGCDEFQGYLIAKPLPEHELSALLLSGDSQW